MPRVPRKSFETLDIKNIAFDDLKLKQLIQELIKKHKIPINKISELLHISRFKIYRILKKDDMRLH